jgi:hypothetical protein
VARFTSIVLAVAFLALGTGMAQHLHNLEHQRLDALRAATSDRPGVPAHPGPLPDDNNCATHAKLHQPVSATAWVPLLVFHGLFVAFLTLLTPEPVSQRPALRLDCRGPPAC